MSAPLGFKELADKIVSRDICTSCFSCLVTCPFKGVLEISSGKPIVKNQCQSCGLCLRVCPRYLFSMESIDSFVFGRKRLPEEDFGVYRGLQIARSTRDDILHRCQDGGVATSLICSAMNSGLIDGAIISGFDANNSWLPVPHIVTKESDIIRFAGSRYSYSSNILALEKCIATGLKKIAFVGLPCQIIALRRIQMVPIKKYSEIIFFTIGLFCSESFTYEGLMIEKIQGELKINLQDLAKMNIKGKSMMLSLKSGDNSEIPLKDIKKYSEKKCSYCLDFSSEFSDISLGGVGLEGKTLAIIRTERGETIFKETVRREAIKVEPIEQYTQSLKTLSRLSRLKR